ncbi:LysR family hydrogen peroxide-inducible transcriptional activator [Rhodoblastus acidophilus]|uniref:hydrogen peroxide-inducible genes activator n=1 Tax=Rhodoblastus acidophilus TaxID=1074 RepID=UPI0022257836|nr:hydrogen peroxide-inducible genes activator [Rhodoblastus acidophilus]MCW2315436.1 LysR family hydrogen peroxide-inducible transcriptional activator [Rhodoblastus acidophilus]
MRNLPTLRQLRFLVAVVERRHFSAAAEDCLVSQSTLSAAIQELEDLLGVRLLERSKRKVIPTAIGLDLAARAKKLLRDAEELVEAAEAARDPLSGALHLGVIPTISPFLAPRIMPVLRAQFPELKVFLREEQSAPLLARLKNGQIDAAILALPYPCDEMETAEFASDPFHVVVPPRHRLANRVTIPPQEMANEDLLLLEDGHCLREHALAACSLEGARRNAGFQGTSLHTLVQMAANGLGVTLVPEMAVAAGILRGLELKAIPLSEAGAARKIALVWRPSSGRKILFRRLAAAFKAELEPDGGAVEPSPSDGAAAYL